MIQQRLRHFEQTTLFVPTTVPATKSSMPTPIMANATSSLQILSRVEPTKAITQPAYVRTSHQRSREFERRTFGISAGQNARRRRGGRYRSQDKRPAPVVNAGRKWSASAGRPRKGAAAMTTAGAMHGGFSGRFPADGAARLTYPVPLDRGMRRAEEFGFAAAAREREDPS